MSATSLLKAQFPHENGTSLQAHLIYKDDEITKAYAKQNPQKLEATNKGGLTPLAVATLLGNEKMVQFLLGMGACPLAPDRHQWTPIHFAEIMEHQQIKGHLVTAAKKIDAAANFQFKYLKQILRPVFPKPDDRVALKKVNSQLVPMTAQEFKMRTGAEYLNAVASTPQDLLAYWAEFPPKRRDPNALARKLECKKLFHEYEKKPPTLYLDEDNICCKEDLPAGKVIGFYGGRIQSNDGHSNEYRVSETNGADLRNLASMIPDGVPNCLMQAIELDGIPRHLIITMKKIKAGENLYIDFGPCHTIKHEYQPVPKEIISFYKKNPPSMLRKQLDANIKKIGSFVSKMEAEGILGEIGYLFSTPFTLIELALDGVFDIDEMDDLMDLAFKYTNLSEQWKAMMLEIVSGLKFFLSMFIPGQISHQGLLLKKDLLKLVREHRLSHVVRSFTLIKQEAIQFDSSDERIQFFKSLKEHAFLDDIVEDWMLDRTTLACAEYALSQMMPRRRSAVILDLIDVVRSKYQHKFDQLFEILSGLELRIWFEKEGEDATKLTECIKGLPPENRYRFYQKRVPHYKARYPHLGAKIDQIFEVNGLSLPARKECR